MKSSIVSISAALCQPPHKGPETKGADFRLIILMNIQRPRKRRLWPSFLMGCLVLLLALLQGGPWPALAAIGRGVGVIRPTTPTPSSDLLPSWQPGLLPTGTATATPRNGRGSVPTTPATRSTASMTPLPPAADVSYSRLTTWSFADEPRIDAMRPLIVIIMKERELVFEGASGRVSTFSPGFAYDALWGRDLSLMLPTVQYLYPEEYLRSGIEELLIRQYGEGTRSDGGDNRVWPGSGAFPASVDGNGEINKETATSDEETTLIHAAYQYYRVAGGGSWLNKELAGIAVLDRLNTGMEWLYSHRFDSSHRLFKRGHTTDWGDVKFEPALNPTDMDPRFDHWTISIYDQAVAFRALGELAEMCQSAGQADRARMLLARAEDLRQSTNRFLWMPERGYYRLHVHITPLTHYDFNEDDIVAIGNIVAVYAGMTTDEQERSIIKNLEQARLAAGARKPGLSLYPAYPTSFFATTQRNRGEYQNGGVWDAWGGIQVAAEFQHGFSDMGLAHLYQIAADWAQHPSTIWEWSLPGAASGRGTRSNATAAGAVGGSIISGLYGVTIARDGLRLEPRLGTHNGSVRVYQSASDRYAAYSYTYKADSISLRYGTNVAGEVSLRVLIPGGRMVQSVRIGASDITPRRESVNSDNYVIFKGPVGTNSVTIALGPVPSGANGVTLDPAFFDYYQNNSGDRLLGAPISPAVMEGTRRVQYFEKGRLETPTQGTTQFTYGTLGEEMLRAGPSLPVGGEVSTITYAKLKEAAAESKLLSAPKDFKSGVYKNRDGTVFIPFSADLKPAPGHNVAAIFWIVLSSSERSPGGWQHDVGLPLTEPVWATIETSDKQSRRILIQAFQYTILTYDAQKQPGWQVERANIGVDYLKTFPERARP